MNQISVLTDKTMTELASQFPEVEANIFSPASSTCMTPLNWEVPILFDEIHVPEIPTTLLPGIYGEFAKALSTATETSPTLSVMVLLSIISVIAAKHFRVSPKLGWQESLNIYTLVGLPPANNKSHILHCCTQPLIAWEIEQAKQCKPIIQQQYSERKTQEKIIEVLRSQAAKEKDRMIQQDLIQKIAHQESTLIEPSCLPQLFVNDVTPESLITAVFEQKGYLGLFSDEGGLIETLAGLYSSGMANVDILLKGIDGGYLRLKRKDRCLDLNPYLTIALVVQPIIIQNMALKKAFCGNGLLERFLYVLPKSHLGYRTHNTPPLPESLVQTYNQVINTFIQAGHKRVENAPPQILTLSTEALQEWQAFQRAIEIELRPNGRLSICLGWGGKICGFALRLAGLLHIAEHGFKVETIGQNTMTAALEIASLLTYHATAAYALMGIDQPTQDAKDLFTWITANSTISFTKSQVLRALRHKPYGKTQRLEKALFILVERHCLWPHKDMTTRKPTHIFYVNPAIYERSQSYGMA